MKCFKKGTSTVIYKLALIEARINNLKQANKILSGRQRAKRTQLQKGRVITAGKLRQVVN